MGLLDDIFNTLKADATREIKKQVNSAVNDAVRDVKKKASMKEQKFTFSSLPTSVDELKALPEAKMDTAYKTAALTIAVLCNFESNPDATFEMLNVLKGPEPVSGFEKAQIKERLSGAGYKSFSFFAGATVENDYVPSTPYTLSVFENPTSFVEENWATMWLKSAGADELRPIKLRKKPSTGEWFLNDIQCLAGIRTPKSADKWA